MKLPERAYPFIEKLRRFVNGPEMRNFAAAGLSEFGIHETDKLSRAEFEFLEDYLAFSHTDKEGKAAVDHLLKRHALELTAEERQVFRRFKGSVLGFFFIERISPGEGLTLRLCGRKETYWVREKNLSQTAERGETLIARIIPYRRHWEISSVFGRIAPEFGYVAERAARAAGPEAGKISQDPVWIFQRIVRASGKERARARNIVEAELFAAQVFSKFGMKITVKELQERMQNVTVPSQLFKKEELPVFSSERELQEFYSAIFDLWNYTPRRHLGELAPVEAYRRQHRPSAALTKRALAQDLLRTVRQEVDLSKYETAEEAKAATTAATRRWFETPQEELGGLTPEEVMEGLLPYESPDPNSLPPINRPLWPRRKACYCIERALAEEKDYLAAFTAGHLLRWGETLPYDLLHDLLENTAIADTTLSVIMHFNRDKAEEALAISNLVEVPEAEPYREALRAGRSVDSIDLRTRINYLKALSLWGDPHVAGFALDTLRQIDPAEAREAARERFDNVRGFYSKFSTLGYLIAGGDESVVQAATDEILAELADLDTVPRIIPDIPHAFGTYGICLWRRIFRAMQKDPDPDSVEQPPLDPLCSYTDPSAKERLDLLYEHKHGEDFDRAWRNHNWKKFIQAAASVLPELLDHAASKNPFFEPAARGILAFFRKANPRMILHGFAPHLIKWFAEIYAFATALALRGRDPVREYPTVKGDVEAVLSLLRLDGYWLSPPALSEIAATVPEDTLNELADSPSLYVFLNTAFIKAVIDPVPVIEEMFTALEEDPGSTDMLVSHIVRLHGDQVVEAAMELFEEEPYVESLGALIRILGTAGTERAQAYLEGVLQWAVREMPIPDFITEAWPILTPASAKWVAGLVAKGRADMEAVAEMYELISEPLPAIRALLELADLKESAHQFMEEALEAYRRENPES